MQAAAAVYLVSLSCAGRAGCRHPWWPGAAYGMAVLPSPLIHSGGRWELCDSRRQGRFEYRVWRPVIRGKQRSCWPESAAARAVKIVIVLWPCSVHKMGTNKLSGWFVRQVEGKGDGSGSAITRALSSPVAATVSQ